MSTIAFIIILFLVISGILIAATVIAGACFSDPGRHFEEPDSDARFSESPGLQVSQSHGLPVLVECDTAGVPTPPNEVNVYEYLWNSSLSAYELSRVTPLSEYHVHGSDPELAQILSSTPPPAVIPGAPAKARLGDAEKGRLGEPEESEFDEIERRLKAPAFRTNHGSEL